MEGKQSKHISTHNHVYYDKLTLLWIWHEFIFGVNLIGLKSVDLSPVAIVAHLFIYFYPNGFHFHVALLALDTANFYCNDMLRKQ